MDLLQSLLTNLWALFLVVFFFVGSIFVHELGHFLAARRRGVFVERFSIGIGPPALRWKGKDGVEYCLSWLPLGGYVKLPQLADLRGLEGDSAIDVSKLPPLSYSTKVLVFVAGAVFNLIFAFLLACVLWKTGLPVREDSRTTEIGYVMPRMPDTKQASPAARAGLQPHDVILAIDGSRVRDWEAVQQALALGSGHTADGKDRLVRMQVLRDGQPREFEINPVLAGEEKIRMIGIAPVQKLVIGDVAPGSFADKIGLKARDRILAADTNPILNAGQLEDYLESHSAGPVALKVARGNGEAEVVIPPHKEDEVAIPITVNVQLVHQNPVEQLNVILASTFHSLASIINPRSDVGLSKTSSIIGIVNQFWKAATSEYPLRVTIWFTILINISLAVFNLLPIPVLDGGHILFATIAKLRGRALPPDFIAAAQSAFVVLLFSLVIYVSFHDVRRMMRSDKPAQSQTQSPPQSVPTVPTVPAKP